ncbi:MAG: site-2 protease family protein [Candidatus Thorarchaeota archaeon]
MLTALQILLIIIMGLLILTSLGSFLKLERFGIHFFPLGLMFKTEFFNKLLMKMGDNWKTFWKWVYNIGKILAGIITIALFGFFLVNPFLILFKSPAGIGLQLIIPGVTMEFRVALLFILPILFVLVPHEIAHGVMARREGIEIKSSGILILVVLFGAFVELAKESVEKADLKKRIKVFMNGSAVNSVFAVFFLILYLLSPFIISIGYKNSDGVLVTKVYDDYPAINAGISRGDIIQSMGTYNTTELAVVYSEINNVQDYSIVLANYVNESLLYLKLLNGTIVPLTPTRTNPNTNTNSTNKIFLGVNIFNYKPPKGSWQSVWFPYYWDIEILYTLNLSIMAVFLNMLPLWISDGDKILRDYLVIKGYNENKRKKILNTLRFFSLCILLINLALSMIRFSW